MYHLYARAPYLMFLLNKMPMRSRSVSLFIPYISRKICQSGGREVKINKSEIWKALTQSTLGCQKYVKEKSIIIAFGTVIS